MAGINQHSLAGTFACLGGVVIIAGVTALKYFFGYPEIIRAEPGLILERLHQTRNIVPYLYYVGVGGAGVCLALFSVVFEKLLSRLGEETLSALGKVCGIAAGVLLYAGIIRYSILFPRLAAMRHSGDFNNETIDLVFKAMNTYIGDSIAEHVQFTFTSLMLLFFNLAILRTKVVPRPIAWFGLVTVAVLLIGNLEQFGVSSAFIFNRTGAKMLAAWLLATGAALLVRRKRLSDVQPSGGAHPEG